MPRGAGRAPRGEDVKLFYSTSSPFARKARVMVREKALTDAVGEHECNPFSDPANLREVNPLGKVPALVTAHGQALYDSPMICEYLDGLGHVPRLLPGAGPARWVVLRAQALADGLLDIGVALTLEGRRPGQTQSEPAKARWRMQMEAALDAMPEQVEALPPPPSLAHIALAVALGYLDFRHPSVAWRDGRPGLAAWFEEFAGRASMRDTAPSDASYRL